MKRGVDKTKKGLEKKPNSTTTIFLKLKKMKPYDSIRRNNFLMDKIFVQTFHQRYILMAK